MTHASGVHDDGFDISGFGDDSDSSDDEFLTTDTDSIPHHSPSPTQMPTEDHLLEQAPQITQNVMDLTTSTSTPTPEHRDPSKGHAKATSGMPPHKDVVTTQPPCDSECTYPRPKPGSSQQETSRKLDTLAEHHEGCKHPARSMWRKRKHSSYRLLGFLVDGIDHGSDDLIEHLTNILGSSPDDISVEEIDTIMETLENMWDSHSVPYQRRLRDNGLFEVREAALSI